MKEFLPTMISAAPNLLAVSSISKDIFAGRPAAIYKRCLHVNLVKEGFDKLSHDNNYLLVCKGFTLKYSLLC